ncbi:MAG: PorV/PorQ family protein [Bacteroidota bacterium]
MKSVNGCVAVVLLLTLALLDDCWAQVPTNEVGSGVEPLELSRVGAAGWQFLKLPTDARGAAMGGVKAAVSYGNANAALNNPASAVDVAGTDIQFSSMNWVADIQYNTLSVVQNLGSMGTIGVHCLYLDYGRMIRTEVADVGDLGIVPITEGLGTFTASDFSAGFLYARQITNFLQVGGTIRYMQQQIDDAKMKSWAVDVGTLYWTGIGSLRISMLGKNFGPDGEFLSYRGRIAQAAVKVKMPMMLILGTAYDIIPFSTETQHRMTVVCEYVKPNDGPEKANLGLEYFAYSILFVRAGYRFNYDEESYTFGVGTQCAIEDGLTLKADFAYLNLGRFNSVSVITIGCGF